MQGRGVVKARMITESYRLVEDSVGWILNSPQSSRLNGMYIHVYISRLGRYLTVIAGGYKAYIESVSVRGHT